MISRLAYAYLSNAFAAGALLYSVAALAQEKAPASNASTAAQTSSGWGYNSNTGITYQKGDFQWTGWGYAERLFDRDGGALWRRVRQGMEFDLPSPSDDYRPTFVYEVDFTDNKFFEERTARIFENLYVAIQDKKDPAAFKLVVGENTHILSREDSLSSGNLPTISRSLILEEHGSVNSFGTQFGVQVQKALSPVYTIALSAQDNRGSLNTDEPKYTVGNSLAGKVLVQALNDEAAGRKLTFGLGADHTRGIEDKVFTLVSAIAAEPLGGTEATGNKLTVEGDVAYADVLATRHVVFEAEALQSAFSDSGTRAAGGYVQGQFSAFESSSAGDLDPFVRYDLVRLTRPDVAGAASQTAVRLGLNYNLPYTKRLANLHLEYAHNEVDGPTDIVPTARKFDEVWLEVRVSLTSYNRY